MRTSLALAARVVLLFSLALATTPFAVAQGTAISPAHVDASTRERVATVWKVDAAGGAQFTQIQPAIDAATSGDVILVDSGTYASFAMTGKGVSVVEDTSAVVHVSGSCSVRDIPAGESAILIGLDINASVPGGYNALEVRDDAGAVRIESCSLRGSDNMFGGDGADALYVLNALDVAVTNGQLTGGKGANTTSGGVGGRGGYAFDSTLALYGCNALGGNGGIGFGGYCSHVGGVGFHQVNGELFAAACSFRGGDGGPSDDCLYGCGGNGGVGLRMQTSPPVDPPQVTVHLLGDTYAGGAGGTHPCGYPGDPGYAFLGQSNFEMLGESSRSMTSPTPVRDASVASLTFHGVSGDHVFLIASKSTAHQWTPSLNGALLVVTPHFLQLDLGLIPASGALSLQLAIDDGWAPFAHSVGLNLQAVFQSASNTVVLGNPSNMIVIDHAN